VDRMNVSGKGKMRQAQLSKRSDTQGIPSPPAGGGERGSSVPQGRFFSKNHIRGLLLVKKGKLPTLSPGGGQGGGRSRSEKTSTILTHRKNLFKTESPYVLAGKKKGLLLSGTKEDRRIGE